MKKPKYVENEIIKQTRNPNWTRTIRSIIKDYLGKKGRFGYWYIDDFTHYGMCSEEHLTRWVTK